MKIKLLLIGLILLGTTVSCREENLSKNDTDSPITDSYETQDTHELIIQAPEDQDPPEGMVWIPGGKFIQGALASDNLAMHHEKPAHLVAVDGFYMDISEVTNSEFQKFVEETGYITLAEREIDWEELKKQLPPGQEKP